MGSLSGILLNYFFYARQTPRPGRMGFSLGFSVTVHSRFTSITACNDRVARRVRDCERSSTHLTSCVELPFPNRIDSVPSFRVGGRSFEKRSVESTHKVPTSHPRPAKLPDTKPRNTGRRLLTANSQSIRAMRPRAARALGGVTLKSAAHAVFLRLSLRLLTKRGRSGRE